jgi:hypothetical protein
LLANETIGTKKSTRLLRRTTQNFMSCDLDFFKGFMKLSIAYFFNFFGVYEPVFSQGLQRQMDCTAYYLIHRSSATKECI